jgi:uracil-DNA glycosylase family 4
VNQVLRKPNTCRGCPLYPKYNHGTFSHPDGTGNNGVMILGEALGQREALTGLPFMGQAGAQINRTIPRIQMQRSDFSWWNTVACRPPNNWLEGAPWHFEAVENCHQYFVQQLQRFKPKVIVPTGNVPLRKLLHISGIQEKRGYVYDAYIPMPDGRPYKCYVVPTVHPAFILRGKQNWTWVQMRDLQKAVDVAKNGPPKYSPVYTLYPSLYDLETFYNAAKEKVGDDVWLTADIETGGIASQSEEELHRVDGSNIDRISFSYEAGTAITVPWTPLNLPWIEKILGLATPYLVFWNADFDVPRLKGRGIKFNPTTKILDAMWMWHFLQSDLPKGLGFVSTFYTPLREWKSRSSTDPELYSCIDSDAAITNTYAIRELLVGQRRFNRFLSHYVELDMVLKSMGRGEHSGVLIDKKGKEEFRTELNEQLDAIEKRIQNVVPKEVKPIDIKKVLKETVRCWRCNSTGNDPDKKKLKELGLTIKKLKDQQGDDSIWETEVVCKLCEGKKTINRNVKPADHSRHGRLICSRLQGYIQVGTEWHKPMAFNVGSTQQMQDYIDHRSHTMRYNHKTGEATTGKEAIDWLHKKYPDDPLYGLVIEDRQIRKVIDQYVDGYKPDEDGRIRTDFYQKPSTQRLNSQNPNVQNISKRNKWAKPLRKLFVSAPNHWLVDIDYSAIEAVLTGFYANDIEYIHAAKLGIHGILASYLLVDKGVWKEPIQLSWSDADITAAVREIKGSFPAEYDAAKHGGHGSNFGATAFKLVVAGHFPSMKVAETVQKIYFDTIGKKIRSWQSGTLRDAYDNNFLENAFQYRHYFWDALHREYGEWIHGQDANRCLAFLPQSTAAAIIKNSMLKITERQPKIAKMMRWQIHDSLLFEIPDDLVDWAVPIIENIMQEPSLELGNLTIGTETEIGRSWGVMNKRRKGNNTWAT